MSAQRRFYRVYVFENCYFAVETLFRTTKLCGAFTLSESEHETKATSLLDGTLENLMSYS